MIPINCRGTIMNGEYQGWTVYVQDDQENTGGYFILKTRENEGYDDWVEKKNLQRYFQESGWQVDWEDGTQTKA
jgi:hypothetical protein